jgi:hypothetical protein
MKLDINVGILDHKVLDWYDNASENEVTNALYHGYRVVSNLEYSKKLDEMPSSNDNLVNKIEMLENQIEMYKTQIKENQDLFNKQMDTLVLETKSRFESQYNGIVKSKDDRIVEIQNTNKELLIEKNERINEKNERIEIQLKVQKTLENELSMSKERCFELESIMNNSSKKGDFAEKKLTEMLTKNIASDMTTKLVSEKSHCADIHIVSNEYKGVILVESKYYSDKKNVYSEIDKFYKDIDKCKSKMDVFSAFFVSYTCDIPGITDNFKCLEEKGIRCYYFANMTEEKFNLLYQIVELEHNFYKHQKISEGNESMTKYLMRIFREISENYRKIEDLSPGYLDIKKAVESAESKFNRALKKVLNDIKLKSDSFLKMTNIDSMNVVNVDDILNIETPHGLNMPQWEGFRSELVKTRVEKNELLKVQDENDNLKASLNEMEQTKLESDALKEKKIKELEKRVETKVARKPRKKKAEDSGTVGEDPRGDGV